MIEKEKLLKDIKVDIEGYKIYLLLLKNYALSLENANEFLSEFHLTDESEIVPFILNPNNGYILSKYGHRNDNFYGYNGSRRIYVNDGDGTYHSCKSTIQY